MILLLVFIGENFAQLSPGDLTKAHSNLEGLSNCTQCHELGEAPTDEKCLNCHKEIKALILKDMGLHKSSERGDKNCFDCHSEHNGVDFDMIHFSTEEFNHERVGYILEGAHAKKDCKDCHTEKNIKDKKIRKREDTFLGLDQNCLTCHKDVHKSQFKKECKSCHTFKAFKPPENFNHDKARFKLTGRHVKTDCEKCHETKVIDGDEVKQFTNLSFASCTSCHKDVHQNKFGNKCSSCHTTLSFHQIKSSSNFNHSMTNFPLVGLHNSVECAKCHGKNKSSKPKHQFCQDCHADYHNGEFAQRRDNDCSACHNEYGFVETSFTLEQHNVTAFKVLGAHKAVPCNECHQKSEKWNFDMEYGKCTNCHNNPHGNSISSKYLGNNKCENCHNLVEWESIKFQHSSTKFPLEGKHTKVLCRKCHVVSSSLDARIYSFKDLRKECEYCHKDNHNGQFTKGNITDCSKCHGFNNWKPAEKFDHNKTNFALDGKHINLNCSSCHKKVVVNGIEFVNYKIEEKKCENCHS